MEGLHTTFILSRKPYWMNKWNQNRKQKNEIECIPYIFDLKIQNAVPLWPYWPRTSHHFWFFSSEMQSFTLKQTVTKSPGSNPIWMNSFRTKYLWVLGLKFNCFIDTTHQWISTCTLQDLQISNSLTSLGKTQLFWFRKKMVLSCKIRCQNFGNSLCGEIRADAQLLLVFSLIQIKQDIDFLVPTSCYGSHSLVDRWYSFAF